MIVDTSIWGYKRVCQDCGTKFYDSFREEIICPSCGTPFAKDHLLKSRSADSASLDDDDIITDDFFDDVDIKDDDDAELGEDKDYIENPDDLSGDDFISTSADDASRSSDGSADDT